MRSVKHRKIIYKEQGLAILDFPCNQFFKQASGSNEEIASFCQLTYNTSFETFAKIEVNGKNAHPLYTFLKKEAPKAVEDQVSEGLYAMLSERGFDTVEAEIRALLK